MAEDYKDTDGNPTSLEKLVRSEPDWAVSRLRVMRSQITDHRAEIDRLRQWVNDLQCGMYINCVYCGHRYGPNDEVPASMADVLKEHVGRCPEHPMSRLRKALQQIIEMDDGQGPIVATAYDAAKIARETLREVLSE